MFLVSVSTRCSLSHLLHCRVAFVMFVVQGSPLSNDAGSPVSFAAIGSYAMGSVGTVLVYVRCVRAGGGAICFDLPLPFYHFTRRHAQGRAQMGGAPLLESFSRERGHTEGVLFANSVGCMFWCVLLSPHASHIPTLHVALTRHHRSAAWS